MKQVIAMHGWSGDATTWDLWAHRFRKFGWEWQNAERGYGNREEKQPQWLQSKDINSSEYRVFIGHSLGPHLITKEVLSQATHVVLLCSFGRFLPKDKDRRSIKIALNGMQEKIGTKEEITMLTKFLSKAYQPYPLRTLPSGPISQGLSQSGREKLKSDLDILIKTEQIPNGLPSNSKVLIVEGEKDAIIANQSKQALKNELEEYLLHPPCYWKLSNTGHALMIPELIDDVYKWLK